jgi:hypothetical protein
MAIIEYLLITTLEIENLKILLAHKFRFNNSIAQDDCFLLYNSNLFVDVLHIRLHLEAVYVFLKQLKSKLQKIFWEHVQGKVIYTCWGKNVMMIKVCCCISWNCIEFYIVESCGRYF